MVTMASVLAVHIQEKVLCDWYRLQPAGPILTPETTGHTPAAVLDARLEHHSWGLVGSVGKISIIKTGGQTSVLPDNLSQPSSCRVRYPRFY